MEQKESLLEEGSSVPLDEITSEVLQRLRDCDPSLTELSINSLTKETATELLAALRNIDVKEIPGLLSSSKRRNSHVDNPSQKDDSKGTDKPHNQYLCSLKVKSIKTLKDANQETLAEIFWIIGTNQKYYEFGIQPSVSNNCVTVRIWSPQSVFETWQVSTGHVSLETYAPNGGIYASLWPDMSEDKNKRFRIRKPAAIKSPHGSASFLMSLDFDLKKNRLADTVINLYQLDTKGIYDFYQAFKQSGCDLVLMSELPEDQIPIKGKMYLAKRDDKLEYIVLTPDNKIVKDTLDFNVRGELTLGTLDSLKSKILQETSKRCHTQQSGCRWSIFGSTQYLKNESMLNCCGLTLALLEKGGIQNKYYYTELLGSIANRGILGEAVLNMGGPYALSIVRIGFMCLIMSSYYYFICHHNCEEATVFLQKYTLPKYPLLCGAITSTIPFLGTKFDERKAFFSKEGIKNIGGGFIISTGVGSAVFYAMRYLAATHSLVPSKIKLVFSILLFFVALFMFGERSFVTRWAGIAFGFLADTGSGQGLVITPNGIRYILDRLIDKERSSTPLVIESEQSSQAMTNRNFVHTKNYSAASPASVQLFLKFFSTNALFSEKGKQIASYLTERDKQSMACINRSCYGFFSQLSHPKLISPLQLETSSLSSKEHRLIN